MTPASAWRGRAGAVAQAEGKMFEQVLTAQLQLAKQSNLIAWFDHAQPVFRRIGGGRFIPVKRGPSDFVGMFNGGLTFALEAKSHKWEPAAPRFYRNRVADQQIVHLDETSRGEGVALLALEFRYPDQPRRHFVVPWREVPWHREKTALSVEASALAGWELDWPLFLRKFGRQCPKCLQVRQTRRYAPGRVLSFCHCGIFDDGSSQLPLPLPAPL